MTATYTFDIFMSLDGFGSHNGDWGGYWGKQGPEFLAHRLAQYSGEQRMASGPTHSATSSNMMGRSTTRSDQGNSTDPPHAEPSGDRGVETPSRARSTGRTQPSPAAMVSTSSPSSRRS